MAEQHSPGVMNPIALRLHDNDLKDDIELDETKSAAHGEPVGTVGIPISPFANMSRGRSFQVFWKAVCFCLMASWAAGMDGYQATIPGSIIANPGFIEVMGTVTDATGNLALDPYHVAAWGGISVAGNIVGPLIAPFIADRFGRKAGLMCLTVLMIIGVILEITAKDWQLWSAAKAFTGMGIGFAQTQCVIYVSELSPTQIRGFLLATYALGFALGQLMASIGLQVLAESAHAAEYKRALYSQFVFTGIFLVMWVIMPESPWYCARSGLHDKGRKVLRYINGGVKGYDVDYEYSIILAVTEQSRQIQASMTSQWSEIFRSTHGRRLLITAMCSIYCQLSGIALVFGYVTYFFQLAGFEKPFLAALVVYLVLMVFVCVAFYTTDKFGRRPVYHVTTVTITLSLLMIGIAGTLPSTSSSVGTVMLVFSCVWVAAYATGPASLAAVFAGETSTPRLRAKTNSFGQGIAQAFSLIITYCVPLMLAKWGVKTAYFFVATSFLGGIAIFFIMPETKGRTYAELDELFERKVSARKFAATKTAAQTAVSTGQV